MHINKEELRYPFHISKPMINIYSQKYLWRWKIAILDTEGKKNEYTQTALFNCLGLDLPCTEEILVREVGALSGLINLRLVGILILVQISQSI